MKKLLALTCLVSVLLLLEAQAGEQERSIVFPENYATSFTNYLSLDRVQNDDQVIRLFANDIALAGPGEDGKLPYGSILVGEVYKAKKDADGVVITSSLGRRIRGDLALIAVMQREQGWGEKFAPELRNEDWDFETFSPDGAYAAKDLDTCRSCHAPLEKAHHLFSIEHLAAGQ